MAFWAENFGEDSTLKDPKRKFRFTVQLNGLDSDNAVLWWAKTVNKPSFTIAAAEHKYLNHTFYYPGSVTWNEISLTLVDPVKPDATATLSQIVANSGYSPPTSPNDLGSMSKAKAATGLGAIQITQLDGDGKALETWTLWNAFISDLKYGDLEYGSDDLTELTMTLKYDWARCEVTTDGSVTTTAAGSKEFFGTNS
jgi:hypothetical protein